jgi:arsenite-transporting ATPase
MTRIIFISGKGGVGKTTVASATALAAARCGYRTLVMSLDIAHSLSDCFDIGSSLFDQNKGRPLNVAPNLNLQEIDVSEEIAGHWLDVHRYFAGVFTSTGLDDVVAEEVAILPGTEDVVALMYINQYVVKDSYDVIVLDAPPTGDSLRFVNLHTSLTWYMRKRFNLDRSLARLARPLVGRLIDAQVPDDGFFTEMQHMFSRLDGVDALLRDPTVTTVRLVTNAEKMVVRESQRAYMYFGLYGMTTDRVIVNRLMPASDGYFADWAATQAEYVDNIREFFQPVPVATLPMFGREVIGLSHLEQVARALYQDDDPARFYVDGPSYEFKKDGSTYSLELPLPFADADDVVVTRVEDDLVIRVGSFKRHVPLPRSMQQLRTEGVWLDGGKLTIRFSEEGARSTTFPNRASRQ